jgi:hypothetical protein
MIKAIVTVALFQALIAGCSATSTAPDKSQPPRTDLRAALLENKNQANKAARAGGLYYLRVTQLTEHPNPAGSTVSFCLDPNDVMNPCNACQIFVVPSEQVIDRCITADYCAANRESVWGILVKL